MAFCNFNSFDFGFQHFKEPITVIEPVDNRNATDDAGEAIPGTKSTFHLEEPVITTNNPNLTYNNVNGGQQSMIGKVWESKAIKDAPRGTIVKTSRHKFKTTGSTHITGSELWYYQLKEVGDRA